MSWGERSCLKPCRCPDYCKMETCNVDCPEYIWDGETRADSKSLEKIENDLRNSKLNKLMNTIGMDIINFFPKSPDPLQGVDLEKEYYLINNKKSKLSSNLRHMVVVRYKKLTRGKNEKT